MGKVYFHVDGTPSPHPTSKNLAIKQKSRKYDSGQKCPDCGDCSIRHVYNDRCIHCARLASIALWNMAVAGKPPDETLPQYLADECLAAWNQYPMADSRGLPASAGQAEQMGSPVWVQLDPCTRAGHPGVRTPEGACWFCEREKSYRTPRQAAQAAGEKWYTPTKPCPRCGTYEPRRVDNAECSGCRAATPSGRKSAASQLPADLIISRTDARTAGLTVFRTGRPCKNGHTGFRYVSTGACIDCMRGG